MRDASSATQLEVVSVVPRVSTRYVGWCTIILTTRLQSADSARVDDF